MQDSQVHILALALGQTSPQYLKVSPLRSETDRQNQGQVRSHAETLEIYKLGFNQITTGLLETTHQDRSV
jgi:hypothetical protein